MRNIKFWRFGEWYRQTKTKSAQKNILLMIKRLSPHIQSEACAPAGFKLRGSLIGTFHLQSNHYAVMSIYGRLPLYRSEVIMQFMPI